MMKILSHNFIEWSTGTVKTCCESCDQIQKYGLNLIFLSLNDFFGGSQICPIL